MSARLHDLRRQLTEGPVVVAIIEAARGSVPREAGAWMIVAPARIVGTIGGGEAEHRAVAAARGLLASGGWRAHLSLPLGPALDQCCGGHMEVALCRVETPPGPGEPLWPGGPTPREPVLPPVFVYGAGHVGAALVQALAPLPFTVTWIDARAEAVWPTPIEAPCERWALPEAAAARAPDNARHIVMTHSHAVDLEIVATVLPRPFAFLGLIGSATKRATFERRLRERGLDPKGLTCPIGIPNVVGKDPAVIAASVAAQLLTLAPHPLDGGLGATSAGAPVEAVRAEPA